VLGCELLIPAHCGTTRRAQARRAPWQDAGADRESARRLLESLDTSTLVGLRDRALIGVMTYALARIGAVFDIKVDDYYPAGKRWWVRLHEKGGKRHEMPAHHELEHFIDDIFPRPGSGNGRSIDGNTHESGVRTRLRAGGRWIRTIGSPHYDGPVRQWGEGVEHSVSVISIRSRDPLRLDRTSIAPLADSRRLTLRLAVEGSAARPAEPINQQPVCLVVS
jgi:hypothetical protein